MTAVEQDALSPLKRAIVEIRDLKARLAAAERPRHEPIAIVGMGLRFPGGVHDADSFWRLLIDGVDAIGEVPADRWSADAFYDPDPDVPGRMSTRWGGFLDDVDRFDAAFFGISPREADSLDPQQRLLLEVAWEALEDAGVPADKLFGTDAGVFVGIGNSDYMRLLLADHDRIDTYTTTGNALSIASGRLAYFLGTQGPAVSVDTACSSSLVAVHLAAQALRTNECDLALAGGVNLMLTPELTINFSRARMMAPDGRCKTFDAAADGYVRSEGCGVVVLKRLTDAQAAGDRILAVVRGSAVNQDGRSGGLTAPNGPSQERVVRAALDVAGIAPEDVGYVEAHGTGTLLGDPIELGALHSALARHRRSGDPLLVGSVKTNFGHTEAAAGVAGLIKAVLVLRHGIIPPHLHLQTLSPHIAAIAPAIAVPTEAIAWPSAASGRVAGVSSFGLSGTNAHVILAEAPTAATTAAGGRDTNVVTLSARSPEALHDLAAQVREQLSSDEQPSLADLAATANVRRSHLDDRLAVIAADVAGVARQLDAFVAGEQPLDGSETFVARAASAQRGGLAFVFTGHGSHHAGMGRALYAGEPVFAAAIDRCGGLLRDDLDRRLHDVLFEDEGLLSDMAYAQPALFALQYTLTELWASWGVHPTIVAGHSAGEYAAAVAAGTLSLADGLKLIAARGRLMATLPDDAAMAALFVDERAVEHVVAGRQDVGIAAINGPTTTVVSGRRDAVRAVIDALDLDDDDWRPLDISVAAHSPLIEPILDAFAAAALDVTLARPQLGLVSSMTGELVADELTTADYWRRHLRAPVRFAAVFETLRRMGCSTVVEIGPHPTLVGLGRRIWPDDSAVWVPSMRRDADEMVQMATALATVHVAGEPVDWAAFDRHGAGSPPVRRLVALPSYPWRRQSYWVEAAGRSPVATQSLWDAATTAAAEQAAQGPLDLQPETYTERWARLDSLATAFLIAAVRGLGLFAGPGERCSLTDLRAAGVAPAYESLVARWMEHLAADGLLVRYGDGFVASAPLPQPDLDAAVAATATACAGLDPLLDYVTRCGRALVDVVTGRESALNTLFPDGSYDTVDFVYGGWAVPRYFNAIVRAAAAAAARNAGRSLRFLEVGAGTGGTSAAVLPAIGSTGASYTYTDVSDFFLQRAAERFAQHRFVQYARLDIEAPPEAQGFDAGSYDVVIAANVLHATRDLDETLAHVHRLLAPGGLLLAYEGTEHPRWFDMATGLIEGWQRFDDPWRTDVPLIDPARWREALMTAGFEEVSAYPGADEPGSNLLQHILVARVAPSEGPAPARFAERPSVVVSLDAPPVLVGDVAEEWAAALPDEREEVLVGAVRRAIAGVLRAGDPDRLRRDQPLLDMGFDSLMAVELRNVLRQALALPQKLPATLVFDHPTIASIASHLDGLLTGQPSERAEAAPDRGQPSHGPTLDVSDVAALSDDEVETMLLSRLSEIES